MNSDEAVTAVLAALEQSGIPYMIVGSLSSNYHGIARSSKDADILLQFGNHSTEDIARLLPKDLCLDPQLSFETATFTSRHIITLADSAFQIELFHLSDSPHDIERFQRRKRVRYGAWDTWVATAEDVIVTKLQWLVQLNRSKDRDDVRDVIAVQMDKIDWPYVESWCDRHGTRRLLEEIRESVAGL